MDCSGHCWVLFEQSLVTRRHAIAGIDGHILYQYDIIVDSNDDCSLVLEEPKPSRKS